jgi:hypothetical protein
MIKYVAIFLSSTFLEFRMNTHYSRVLRNNNKMEHMKA